eukprot:Clim_evm40s242 gene=Clim_evmTU40s242
MSLVPSMRSFFDDEFFSPTVWRPFQQSWPVTEAHKKAQPHWHVQETEGQWVIEGEMPGIKPEDLSIEVNDNNLVVSGKYGEEQEKKMDDGSTFYSRYHGSFQRSFGLPAGVTEDQVKASYGDGLLRVAIPRTSEPEKPETKKITIEQR